MTNEENPNASGQQGGQNQNQYQNQNQGNWQQQNQQQSENNYNNGGQGYYQAPYRHDNKKMAAGLLGLLLGCWGIHKFVLGYNNEGFILLGSTLVSILLMCVGIGFLTIAIPCVIGFIEGIIYLTKSDEEFYQTYQVRKQAWF
jgi:TM2 domain-containing membrane protein YozV